MAHGRVCRVLSSLDLDELLLERGLRQRGLVLPLVSALCVLVIRVVGHVGTLWPWSLQVLQRALSLLSQGGVFGLLCVIYLILKLLLPREVDLVLLDDPIGVVAQLLVLHNDLGASAVHSAIHLLCRSTLPVQVCRPILGREVPAGTPGVLAALHRRIQRGWVFVTRQSGLCVVNPGVVPVVGLRVRIEEAVSQVALLWRLLVAHRVPFRLLGRELFGGLQPVLGWERGTGTRPQTSLMIGLLIELVRAEIGLAELLRSRQLVTSPYKIRIEQRRSKVAICLIVLLEILVDLG